MKHFFAVLLASASVVLSEACLHAEDQQPPVRIAAFADVHLNRNGKNSGRRHYEQQEEVLRRIIGEINASAPSLAINLGDLANHDWNDLRYGRDMLRRLTPRLVNIPGNHDYMAMNNAGKNAGELLAALGETTFRNSLVLGKWRIVTIDTSGLSLYRLRKDAPGYETMQKTLEARFPKFNLADGGPDDAEIARVESELAAARQAGQMVLLVSHIPLEPDGRSVVHRIPNSDVVLKLIGRYPDVVRFALAGHLHAGFWSCRGNVGFLTVKGTIETPSPTWVELLLFDDRIEIKGHGDETSRTFRFLTDEAFKNPDPQRFDAYYSPACGCDPERIRFASAFNYQQPTDEKHPAYYEIVVPEGRKTPVLRIVSHGDPDIVRNSQWSHFHTALPKEIRKIRIEFEVRPLERQLKTPQFNLRCQLAVEGAPAKTAAAAVTVSADRLTLCGATVLQEDLASDFHAFVLELDTQRNSAKIFRKGQSASIAEQPLKPGSGGDANLRFGDGTTQVFGSADLSYIGWKSID